MKNSNNKMLKTDGAFNYIIGMNSHGFLFIKVVSKQTHFKYTIYKHAYSLGTWFLSMPEFGIEMYNLKTDRIYTALINAKKYVLLEAEMYLTKLASSL